MPVDVFNNTLNRGISYTCNSTLSPMLSDKKYGNTYKTAYDWVVSKMKDKNIKPPKDVHYPVWAWHTLDGKHRKPDFRTLPFTGFKIPMVCLEVEIDNSLVLLSDEELWTTTVLSDLPCIAHDENSDEELDWYLDSKTDKDEKEVFKLKSWDKIFDLSHATNIQATYWVLRPENVLDIKYFGKR